LGDLKEDLKVSEPPGYRLKEPRRKPKIGPYLERIAQIIEEDKSLPKKQRHTPSGSTNGSGRWAMGGNTPSQDRGEGTGSDQARVFMPLIHKPGEAQVDFGYAW